MTTIDAAVHTAAHLSLPSAQGYFRAYTPRLEQAGKVDRENRVIYGYSVATRGEAMGHGVWIDDVTLGQIEKHGNAAPKGLKSRFTHPGLCGDGLGKYLGRSRTFRRADNRVIADLAFSDTTSHSPGFDQDPAEYLMDLAEEDPHAFASSIVFAYDAKAMEEFMLANGGRWEDDGEGGRRMVGFKSPNADNTQNLPHVRIAKLRACDIVDEPAANPGGFFTSGDERAAQAEHVLSWIFGVSETAPAPEALGGGQPDRIREFVHSFLARHGLEVHSLPSPDKEDVPMAEQDVVKAREEAAAKTREEMLSRLKAFKAAFPGDEKFAVESFEAGLELVAAQAKFSGVLQERLAAKDAEIAKLQEKLTTVVTENTGLKQELGKGEATPVPHGATPKKQSFAQIVEAYRAEHKCSTEQAVRLCALAHPAEYAADQSPA